MISKIEFQDLNKRLSEHEKLFLFEQLRDSPQFILTCLEFALKEDKNHNFMPFWYLDHFFYVHDDIFLEWMPIWIESLLKVEYYGSKRSLLRLLVKKKRPFTEEQEGVLIDFAIKHLENRFEEIAVHSSSMKLLCQMVPKYPEIGSHIKLLVDDDFNNRSKAFQSIGRKLLKLIDKHCNPI